MIINFFLMLLVITIAVIIVGIYDMLITMMTYRSKVFWGFITIVYTSSWITVAIKIISLIQEK